MQCKGDGGRGWTCKQCIGCFASVQVDALHHGVVCLVDLLECGTHEICNADQSPDVSENGNFRLPIHIKNSDHAGESVREVKHLQSGFGLTVP